MGKKIKQWLYLKSSGVFLLLEKSGFCASGWRSLSDAADTEAVATRGREGCFSYPESNLASYQQQSEGKV